MVDHFYKVLPIDKLYNRTYDELLEQAVYQSFKSRGVQKENFEGLLRIFGANKVIQGLKQVIEVDLRRMFDSNLRLNSLAS